MCAAYATAAVVDRPRVLDLCPAADLSRSALLTDSGRLPALLSRHVTARLFGYTGGPVRSAPETNVNVLSVATEVS